MDIAKSPRSKEADLLYEHGCVFLGITRYRFAKAVLVVDTVASERVVLRMEYSEMEKVEFGVEEVVAFLDLVGITAVCRGTGVKKLWRVGASFMQVNESGSEWLGDETHRYYANAARARRDYIEEIGKAGVRLAAFMQVRGCRKQHPITERVSTS